MTGKLIKYELKASIKILVALWVILPVASTIAGISINLSRNIAVHPDGTTFGAFLTEVLPTTISVILAVLLFLTTIIIVIMRFYKGLLGEEGYLMHTLPVKPWQLIISKGVTAGIFTCVGIIVAMISLLLFLTISESWEINEMYTGIKMLMEDISRTPSIILIIFEGLIVVILSILKSIYQIYASLSIGQLADKHRLMLSVGAYIGISIALSILAAVIMKIVAMLSYHIYLENIFSFLPEEGLGVWHIAMLLAFIITVIQLAAFYIISERLLSRKLNLL